MPRQAFDRAQTRMPCGNADLSQLVTTERSGVDPAQGAISWALHDYGQQSPRAPDAKKGVLAMESDALIRRLVTDELDFEPAVQAEGIGVAVKDGVVTLTGHVPSYVETFAAVRAAQRVKGVRAVAQELSVRIPNGQKRHDDEIAERALKILAWSAGGAGDIKVAVSEGWLTLAGEVATYHEKQAAESAVRQLGGVVGVNNGIAIRPIVDASSVKESIARAFKRNADLETSAVRVEVTGSTVTLSGRVKTWHERRMAEYAAWAIPGVREVRDQITF
jgi:osmotically-inducible protein OsmY